MESLKHQSGRNKFTTDWELKLALLKVCPQELYFERYTACKSSSLENKFSKDACKHFQDQMEQCEAMREEYIKIYNEKYKQLLESKKMLQIQLEETKLALWELQQQRLRAALGRDDGQSDE